MAVKHASTSAWLGLKACRRRISCGGIFALSVQYDHQLLCRRFLHSPGSITPKRSGNLNILQPLFAPKQCETHFGVCSIKPQPKKCNEDAWAVYDDCDVLLTVVADGVSAWRRLGIDPAIFSNQLAMNISLRAQSAPSRPPHLLLKDCYHDMLRKEEAYGSCTLCLASLHKATSTLHLAVLGDCGIRVFRGNQVVYRTAEQYHSRNVPYQIGVIPSHLRGSPKPSEFREEDGRSSTSVDAALVDSIRVQQGDVILLASDGLYDNLWDDEIVEILDPATLKGSPFELENAAKILVHQASHKAYADSFSRPTPHAYKVCGGCEECTANVIGGNIDDVTALITYVS